MVTALDASQVCLIVPAFEPSAMLVTLIERLSDLWYGPMVVVDDGSTSGEARSVFDSVRALGCTVLEHEQNRGKGAALKTAFSWCLEHESLRISGAVTADADGQHLPEDILAVRDALLSSSPHTLVMGCRDFSRQGIPGRSVAGNRVMSGLFKLFFGIEISDTQTGLRGIPASFMRGMLGVPSNGYEFETDMLLETRSACIDVLEVPIHTVYEDGNKSSHFRPLYDSLRVMAVFVRFSASSLASSLVDLACFAALCPIFSGLGLAGFSIACATLASRLLSGLANYAINRNLVFNRGATSRSGLRYAALWLACACASACLVTLLCSLLSFIPSVLCKALVDVLLFFVNYRVQESWVFKSEIDVPAVSKEGLE